MNFFTYYAIGLVEDTPASIFPIEAQVAEKGIEPLTYGYYKFKKVLLIPIYFFNYSINDWSANSEFSR